MKIQSLMQFINSTPMIRRIILPVLFIVATVMAFISAIFPDNISSKLFQVLICFLLVAIWNLLADCYADPNVRVFSSAEDSHAAFIDIIKRSRHCYNATILQHSLLYAKDIFREIMKKDNIKNVDLYIKHPETAIHQGECGKILATIHDLEHNKSRYLGKVNVYFYTSSPSFRGALVEGVALIGGWYIYSKPSSEALQDLCPFQIFGHDTPGLVIRSDAKEFIDYSEFINRVKNGMNHNSISYTSKKDKL